MQEIYGGVGGGGAAKVSLSGNNTSGTKTLISTGTLYLAGGDNITISQEGNSLTISGAVNTGATTFQAGVSTIGNTLGVTGTQNNRLVLAGINNITLSQSVNAGSVTVTISGPTLGAAQTGISSIVASDTTYTSGQVIFVGSNAATVRSGAGQSVVIDVPAHTVQTGISSIVASDATYTSGQVIFTGAGAVTVSSGANQSVIINAPVQSVQPEGTVFFGVSSEGNTVGSTGMASGTGPRIVFVGGNNITLSQSLDAGSQSATVTISGANAGGAQTGISGISGSDTVYTSGTVKFTGSNIVTVKSGTGQALIIDASTSQSVQSYNILSASGNTSGTLTSFTSGTIVFAGGNNITLSQSSNSITISGAEGGGAGISTYGNTAGTTGIAGDQLILVGGSNVSLSQSIDAGSSNATITINAGGGFAAGMGASGNTAGTIGTVNAQLYFVGGDNISLSQSINGQSATITFDGASGGTGAGFTAGMSSEGNTSGTSGLVPGQVVFVGGNNVTLSQSINASSATITISGPTGGGAGMGSQGNTYGTTGSVGKQLYFVGSDNISLSQSVNGASATLSIIGATQAGGSFSAGVSSGGNTSGDTGTVSNRLVLAGGNNITLSQSTNASGATVTISAGASGAGGFDMTLSGNTSGTLADISSGTLTLAGGNNITLSQVGNAITISGANVGGAQTGISGIAGSDTTYTSGTVVFTGTNNITVQSGTGQRIIISGPTGGGAGMGTGANTSGTSGTVGKELFFYGGSNISLSQSVNGSSASLSIIGASGGGGGMKVGVSDIGNTSGETGTFSNQVVFAGGNNVTLSGATNSNGVTYTISGANIGGAQTGISSIINSETTYTSGAVSFLGSNIVTVKSGTGQALYIDATVPAQSVQTWNVVSADGNTSGTLASYTSGTIVFAGGNNITLSQSSNTITISGPNLPDPPPPSVSVGVSNVGNTSGNTGIVNNEMVLAGGNNITLSQSTTPAGITVTISGPNTVAQTVQTYNVLSASGNTSGTLTSFTSGTLVLAGGNNITLSQSSNSITISGPSGGGAGMGTGTNTSGTSGTVGKQLYFYGNSNIGLSQSVDGSSASLTIIGNAGGGGIAASVSGNTSGTKTVISSGTLYLAGGNNITLSQDGQSVTISGANVGGAQTGISGIADSATTVTVGTVQFSNANGVSFGLNGSTMTASVSQSVQPEGVDTIGMSNLGNTAGTSGVVNGSNLQFFLAGGNNITLSQSINGSSATLTISGVNTVAQTAQTGISGLGANGTTFTSGTVIFSDFNNVSFGTSGAGAQQTITASASYPAQTNQNITFYATSNTISSSQGTINASSIILKGNDKLSVGVSNGSLIFEAGGGDSFTGSQVIGMSNLSNTSGTSGVVSGSAIRYYLAGGPNVTLSQSLNGVSGTVTISAAAQSVQTQGMVSINGSTGAMSFNAGDNMSLSTNGSSLTFINVLSSSGIAQPVSNVSSAGTQSSRYALADHAHQGVAGLNASGTASTFVGNVMLSGTNITLVTGGNSTAGSIGFSAGSIPASSAYAANVSNVSSAGTKTGNFALADHAHIGVAGIVASGTATTFVGNLILSAGTNITLTTGGNSSAGTIAIVGPTGGGAGMGTGTNTSGTSGTVGKQLYFYGNSNIGLSQSVDGSSASLTITAGGGGGVQTIGMSNVGNTSGDTTPVTGAAIRVVFAGGNNVTLSQSTNGSSATVTISAAAAAAATVSEWMPPGVGYSSFTQMGQSSLALFQIQPPYYVTATRADMWASISVSTSSNSSHDGRISLYMGIYTRNASTLSLASSGSASHSWNVTGSTSSGSVVGWRDLTLPIDVNLTPGRYWVGVISATATTNANWFTASNMGLIPVPAGYSGPLGATNATNQMQLGNGIYSAQTAALPASVAFSQINASGASTARPIVNFVNVTI